MAAFAVSILLPGTIGVGLWDRDEGWYVRGPVEMATTGEWLVPTFNGRPYLLKPPLVYWLVAAGQALLGPTIFAGRLVSILTVTAACVATARLGAELFGRRVGVWGGLIMASFLTTTLVGKITLTDGPLLLCVVLAAAALVRMLRWGPTPGRSIMFWTALGLGTLAKGPAILAFVVPMLVMARLVFRRHAVWRARHFYLGSLLLLALALPWYVYIYGFRRDLLGGESVLADALWRLVRPQQGHFGPPGMYLAVSLIGLLPWTLAAIAGLRDAWRRRLGSIEVGLLLCWLIPGWIVLELMLTKMVHYILPAYPAIALLTARWLFSPIRHPRAVRTGPVAALVVVWGLHQAVGWFVLPRLEPYRFSPRLAAAINAQARPGDGIVLWGYEEPSVIWYLGRNAFVPAGGDELSEVVARYDRASPAVFALGERKFKLFAAARPQDLASWDVVAGINHARPRFDWKRRRFEPERVYIKRIGPAGQ